MSEKLKFFLGLGIFVILFFVGLGFTGYLEEKHQETMVRIKCESLKKESP